jgi:hypothetical protein
MAELKTNQTEADVQEFIYSLPTPNRNARKNHP